jgi:hypothetical protein
MLQTIFFFLIAAVVIVLGLAMMKPDSFSVTRVATMKATPDKVFNEINDFHHWAAWSPWEPLDPQMKKTYSGANSGVGAIYEWDGNKKVGAGRMEILESMPTSKIVIKLDFMRPFEGHNTTDVSFESQELDSTKVTWTMYGPAPFMSKIMQVFMNMDKMIGKDFERGLSNLKSAVEK